MKTNYKNYKWMTIAIFFMIFLYGCKQPDFDINNQEIRQIVEKNADSVEVHRFFPDKDVRQYLHEEFNEFYKNRDYKLTWLSFDEPKEIGDELLLAIDNAEKEGLVDTHYNLKEIEGLLADLYNIESRKERRKEWRKKLIKSKKFKERFREKDSILFNKIVKLDLLMTASYLTYASHLLSGKINPDEHTDWYSEPRKRDLSKHLSEAIDEEQIQESLLELNPPHHQYELLKEQLAKYREFEKNGGWEKYKIPRTVTQKDTGKVISLLRKRLAAEGFDIKDDTVFSDDLKKTIQTYQMLHGLEITGNVDEKTKNELNKPVQDIIKKIAFNMERLRWIHGPFGDHYVMVNIPAFQMTVMRDAKPELQMKAIVGETVNKTPVFYDSLEYVVFSPEWNVPKSIAVEEMLPSIRRDPFYLKDRNYLLYDSWDREASPIPQSSVDWDEVTPENFNFRIVEKPGPKNSLGRVKFMFPNNKAVYLHDTPADYLFARNVRNFSHGCIRLEKPTDFALYLLAGKGWNRDEVQKYMHKQDPSTILLDEKIPVYIVYWTAWVDEKNGMLNIRDDVYSYDKAQMHQLKNKEKELEEEKVNV